MEGKLNRRVMFIHIDIFVTSMAAIQFISLSLFAANRPFFGAITPGSLNNPAQL